MDVKAMEINLNIKYTFISLFESIYPLDAINVWIISS